MAFVREVIRCSISFGSMHSVSGSISAKTIVAPREKHGRQEAQYVMLGQIISSPTPTLQPYMADCTAPVPVDIPSAYVAPCQAANSFSNSMVTSVPDIPPRRSTSSTASSSSFVTIGQLTISPGSEVTAFGPPNNANLEFAIIRFPFYLKEWHFHTPFYIHSPHPGSTARLPEAGDSHSQRFSPWSVKSSQWKRFLLFHASNRNPSTLQ